MDVSSATTRIGRRSPGDVLSTRGGAMAVAAVAAVLAGVLLFAFVQRYRSNQNAASASTTVFVARSLIPQGSSASAISSQQLLQRTALRGSQVQAGAITDPSVLRGEVAVTNIYPGQQITAADFTPSTTIASELSGEQRAIAVPVDSFHGLIGFVHTGEYIDVLASFPGGTTSGRLGVVTKLLQDVLVLSAPSASSGGGLPGGNSNSNIVLRVSEKDAASVAYAADNGKMWVLLRPPLGATQSPSTGATGTGG
jgi:Flp pilus assembly protein CpaB